MLSSVLWIPLSLNADTKFYICAAPDSGSASGLCITGKVKQSFVALKRFLSIFFSFSLCCLAVTVDAKFHLKGLSKFYEIPVALEIKNKNSYYVP